MNVSRSRSLGLAICAAVSLTPSAGCLNRPIEPIEPKTTKTVVERIKQDGVDKIDLLLAIDNSGSMADKQEILALAVPDLIERLVNPLCVHGDGTPQPTQPASPTAECDDGFAREFRPILDINVGVISSSLGGLGADQCVPQPGHDNDDKAHLLTRRPDGTTAPTYESQGFLAWDPGGARGGTSDKAALVAALTDMVVGVEQVGCGYEMQLESIYRFLVDPKPYATLEFPNMEPPYPETVKSGVDQALLDQRAAFLRPDSLVAILLLTDENDCSVVAGGQAYGVLMEGTFYKGATICQTDPTNACCYSCGASPPAGCPADPACAGEAKYDATKGEDSVNLRCWRQRQRYGFDALYPVARYVNALSQREIATDSATLAVDAQHPGEPNPLFTSQRGPDLVFMAGIVGVPWQAVAKKDANGTPDLALGFRPFGELAAAGFFEAYAGDPDGYVDPTNPIMKEDYQHRGVGPTEPNGGDRSLDTSAPRDLQYACVFPLNEPVPNGPDCGAGSAPDSPLCDPVTHSTQISAKAYPSTRELAVLRGLGAQGIPASICPANIDLPGSADDPNPSFGYRPAIRTIVDRLKDALGGKCLPFKLKPLVDGSTPCVVVEASHQDEGQSACDGPGRHPVTPAHQPAVAEAMADAFAPTGGLAWNSFCEITQLPGNPDDPNDTTTPRHLCQNLDDPPAEVNGWCYVDATTLPPLGNAELKDLEGCGDNEKRLVRFVNDGGVAKGATAFITCSGEGAQ